MIKFTQCKCQVDVGKFDVNEIPLDCPAVWRFFASGRTVGVFQLENKLGQDWATKVRPQNIEELAALVSLLRPGPLESGLSQDYVDIKFGKQKISYLHPALKSILDSTYGCMVYQEQALRIATDLAGFSPEIADELRKAIGKKKPELMAKIKSRFIKGVVTNQGIDTSVAEEIFGWIEKCQRYSFNKCFSGETVIRRSTKGRYLNECGYTIEHMYRIRHDMAYAKAHGHEALRRKWNRLGNYGKGLSLCSDGRIRPNIIEDIQCAGQRQVYKITLDNGSTISATANHKFPTPTGEKALGELTTDDSLYVCGEYDKSDFNSIGRFSNQTKDRKGRKYRHAQCGFPSGSENPAYTNGSYTKFRQYQHDTPDICEKCGKTDCRIETAHLDGHRSNSTPENLSKLCVACHKRHDYSNGRTRRGEKGYPSEVVKIKSIIPNGTTEVWDVTMSGPNHSVVVNDDIVACNSHAVSYAMIAYQTAWIKCHFPHEFFTSYLTFSQYKGDPKEEIYKLVQDARLFGVSILAPDIRRGNVHFKMVENGHRKAVAFGLAHIRGVGDSAVRKILSIQTHGDQIDLVDEIINSGGNVGVAASRSSLADAKKEKAPSGIKLTTWADFLASVPDFHRNVGIALIKSGACDCYGMGRSEMVRELEIVLGTTMHDNEGKKREVKGLTAKEKEHFFDLLQHGDMTTREILTHMAQPPGEKTKPLSQLSKAELVERARGYFSQAEVAFGELIDGDEKFVYTTKSEKDVWLQNVSSRKKQQIIDLLRQNGYQDIVKKPPCSNDARRSIVASKADMLKEPIVDTNTANAMAEKYFLGISLSCSPADDADSSLATHTCLDVAQAPNGTDITVCAIVDSVKHIKTKRGKNPGQPMCFLTVSDSTYSIDYAVVFPDVFGKLKAFCKPDLICLVHGKKQNGSFIVADMQKLI